MKTAAEGSRYPRLATRRLIDDILDQRKKMLDILFV
jgi:hypothetical protein